MYIVKKTIVSKKSKQLVGIVCQKFKAKKAPDVVMSIDEAKSNIQNIKGVFIMDGRLVGTPTAKLNRLPMCMIDESYKRMPEKDNGIEVCARYVKDQSVLGYQVDFKSGSGKENYRIDDIFVLSEYFKPLNFKCKTSKRGIKHLVGVGNSLEDLPTIQVVTKESQPIHQAESTKLQDIYDSTKEAAEPIGLVSLLQLLRDHNATLIDVSTTEYQNNNHGTMLTHSIRLISSPVPFYCQEGDALKLRFVQKGESAKEAPQKQPFTEKTVFENGNYVMDAVGIGIPNSNDNLDLSGLLGSQAIYEARSEKNYPRLCVLDLNQIPILTDSEIANSRLTEPHIKALIIQHQPYILARNFAKGHKSYLSSKQGSQKPLQRIKEQYRTMSKEQLEYYKQTGVNIFSSPDVPIPLVHIKEKEPSPKKRILYDVKGYDITEWTYEKITKALKSGNPSLPEWTKKNILNVIFGKQAGTLLESCNCLISQCDKLLKTFDYKMWLNRVALLAEAKGANKIYQNERYAWDYDISTAHKTIDGYYSNVEEGLIIFLDGVEI